MQITERHQEYWRRNLVITAVLLFIWFVVTYVMAWFAIPLAEINFFGWPLSFYMAAQGSLIAFVVLLFWVARRQDTIDREFGVAEDEDR